MDYNMSIAEMSPSKQRKVIKLYLDAFRRQPVPCGTCIDSCCKGCGYMQGYISNKEQFEAAKEKYGFDAWRRDNPHAKGFLGENGCKIPYKERSNTCISFTCHKMTKDQRDAGLEIRKIAYT